MRRADIGLMSQEGVGSQQDPEKRLIGSSKKGDFKVLGSLLAHHTCAASYLASHARCPNLKHPALLGHHLRFKDGGVLGCLLMHKRGEGKV